MSPLTYLSHPVAKLHTMQEVVPGIYWLRMAMPFSLDHINLWLIEDDESWTLIDTGPNTEKVKANWASIFSNQLKNKPIDKVICTHAHPDHLGLAGWIVDQQNSQLFMSAGEHDFYRQQFANEHTVSQLQIERFYQAVGADKSQSESYLKHIKIFSSLIYPVPKTYQRLKDKDLITLGGEQWQIHVGRGHSPEHLCLFCPHLNLLISGDQLLPTISSNVSVWPSEPNANPMQEFLQSCHQFSRLISNDTLVLPAHGLPFYGGVNRLAALISTTQKDLDNLYEFCHQPRRVDEVFPVLFKGEIGNYNRMLAFGEALACLNLLSLQGRLKVKQGFDNSNYYQQQ